MSSICPECGARLSEGRTCQSIFDEFLILDFTDPGYGEVHMLNVACYMIQHGKYSQSGLDWIAEKLRLHLEGTPTQKIRRMAGREVGQGQRDWKVTRRPDEPPQPRIAWSMTIADVQREVRDAESYREQIRRWARLTLQEMQPLLSKAR
jgi:hypothetical protein